eukprot:TRINITY_DN8801_c0_g1_i1.p1 TRINITY_DN8801_c0_g1~~TRINITY_DN8801_c0_g1_i1.p1  ORF type:complete len:449 (-),score=106.60 TRINITY_DN8801_c0_g1_i1:26-1372(-)
MKLILAGQHLSHPQNFFEPPPSVMSTSVSAPALSLSDMTWRSSTDSLPDLTPPFLLTDPSQTSTSRVPPLVLPLSSSDDSLPSTIHTTTTTTTSTSTTTSSSSTSCTTTTTVAVDIPNSTPHTLLTPQASPVLDVIPSIATNSIPNNNTYIPPSDTPRDKKSPNTPRSSKTSSSTPRDKIPTPRDKNTSTGLTPRDNKNISTPRDSKNTSTASTPRDNKSTTSTPRNRGVSAPLSPSFKSDISNPNTPLLTPMTPSLTPLLIRTDTMTVTPPTTSTSTKKTSPPISPISSSSTKSKIMQLFNSIRRPSVSATSPPIFSETTSPTFSPESNNSNKTPTSPMSVISPREFSIGDTENIYSEVHDVIEQLDIDKPNLTLNTRTASSGTSADQARKFHKMAKNVVTTTLPGNRRKASKSVCATPMSTSPLTTVDVSELNQTLKKMLIPRVNV